MCRCPSITAPAPAFMDSFYIDPSTQDSRQNRSRSNSHLSATTSQFQGLHIQNISASDDQVSTNTTPDFRTDSPASFFHPSPYPSPHISQPEPQQLTPFPLLSQSDLDADWSYLAATEGASGSTPMLRIDPAQQQEQLASSRSSIRSNSNPAAMSTLGIQHYDSRFDAGMHGGLRHTYTWPQFEINEQFIQNPSPGLLTGQLTPNLYEEPKMMSMYSRSLSSSPPRPNLTAEQRELKRQRDHARRDSKTQVRMSRERSTSNPYSVSQSNSPNLMPRTLPEYTSSLTPSPLLSQGSLQSSPALGSGPFLNPYSPQIPQISDQSTSDVYGPVYTMGPNDFSTVPAYQMPYPQAGDAALQSFLGRPHSQSMSSISDHGSMYRSQQVSPKMGSSDSGDHVRVVHSRPKPQCWEHGCNGRQFSTFSNLLRHQREKSGIAQKSSCPNCGAEFTRTTARNGHMAHDKCKQRRNS